MYIRYYVIKSLSVQRPGSQGLREKVEQGTQVHGGGKYVDVIHGDC